MQNDDGEEYPSVQNRLNFFDMIAIQSMPYGVVPRIVLLTAIGMLIGYCLSSNFAEPFYKVLTTVGFGIYFVAVILLSTWRVFKNSEKNTTATLQLRPDKIDVTTAENIHSQVEWTQVINVERKNSAVVIQISKTPKLYYWIPDRNFRSSKAADHYYEKANEYWSQWLLAGSTEGKSALPDIPSQELTFVKADMTLKEAIYARYYLFRQVVYCGIFISLWGIGQAILIDWSGLALILGGLALICLPAIGAWRTYKLRPELFTARTSLTEQGVRPYSSLTGHDTTIPWEALTAIHQKGGLIFFEMSNRRGFVLPLRCFDSKDEADKFMALAKSRWFEDKEKRLLPKK